MRLCYPPSDLKRKSAVRLKSAPQQTNRATQVRIVRTIVNCFVKSYVLRRVLLHASRSRNRVALLLDSDQRFSFALRHATRRQSGAKTLQLAEYFIHVKQLWQRNGCNENAMIPTSSQYARRRHLVECFTHRSARYAKPGRNFALIQALIRSEPAGDNIVLECGNDLPLRVLVLRSGRATSSFVRHPASLKPCCHCAENYCIPNALMVYNQF